VDIRSDSKMRPVWPHICSMPVVELPPVAVDYSPAGNSDRRIEPGLAGRPGRNG